jgi:Uma2 family endonuclease
MLESIPTMSLAITQTRYTPDDLLRLEDEGLFELVDGILVEKQMSSIASETAGLIGFELVRFTKSSKSGDVVYPEQSFRCFARNPDLIRRPDVALILASRVAMVPEEGHLPIAPDLVVEVISPNDKMYEFEEKLEDYLAEGVKVVWEVNPKFRFLRIHRPDCNSQRLVESDTLSGELVLPGFSMLVKDLLPPLSGNRQAKKE